MTRDEFSALAHRRLLADPPQTWNRSDDDMNERARMISDEAVYRPAAVLIPIICRDAGLSVLFTQRNTKLSKHAGQIAFPGGRLDKGETALAAALRETEEETGLHSHYIEPLGYLDGYLTITAYLVTPVVAFVREGFTISLQPGEVDEVFEVPLSFLLDPENRRIEMREWKGKQRRYYAYPFEQRYIWGATAGMIKNLTDRLYG